MPKMYKVSRYKAIREIIIYEADNPDQAIDMAKNSVDDWQEDRVVIEGYHAEELVE